MKDISSALIEELNATADSKGIFFGAIAITRVQDADPPQIDYFCDYERPISYKGNAYTPTPIKFSGIKLSSSMEIPSNELTLSNAAGIVDTYVEDNNVDVSGNDISIFLLFMDKTTGEITQIEQDILQVMVLKTTRKDATIFCGLNLRLGDPVPRQTLETNEFPGIRADSIRAGT